MVTRAVAGPDRLCLFYRPDHLIDKKIEHVMEPGEMEADLIGRGAER